MIDEQAHIKRVVDSLSSKYWSFKYLEGGDCPIDLYALFAKELSHIPLTSWPDRFAWGGVFINGHAALENVPLTPPCRVEYYEPRYDYLNPEDQFPPFRSEYVLFTDGELAFIFKPSGIPCVPAREQRKINFKAQLEEYFQCPIHMPSRLDTSVSGLMAISLKDRFHDQLQRMYEKRMMTKHYLLLVKGRPTWDKITVDAPIGRDMRHAVLRKVTDTGKAAITEFELLGTGEFKTQNDAIIEASLIKAKPITGRTHQIRIHAAHLGFPIIGDRFYGHEDGYDDDGNYASTVHLLSYQLKFKRPITGVEIDFKIPQEMMPQWSYQIPLNIHKDLT